MASVEVLPAGRFASSGYAPFPNIKSAAFVVLNLPPLGILSWSCRGGRRNRRSVGDGGFDPNSVAIIVQNLLGEIRIAQFIHDGVGIVDNSKVEGVVGIGSVTRLFAKRQNLLVTNGLRCLLRSEKVARVCQLDAIIVAHCQFELFCTSAGVVGIDKVGFLEPSIFADVVVPSVIVVPIVGIATIQNEHVVSECEDVLRPSLRVVQRH